MLSLSFYAGKAVLIAFTKLCSQTCIAIQVAVYAIAIDMQYY